jgi:hypothetical protein
MRNFPNIQYKEHNTSLKYNIINSMFLFHL